MFVLVSAPLWIPIYAVIAATILLLDGPPVHYRARRVGLNGRPLSLLKFRSMHVDADSQLSDLLTHRPWVTAEYARYKKLHRDPRITPVGGLLRRFSLDEVPQLFQVLRGELSLVGPRPITQEEIDTYYGDRAMDLLSVPPGLTGLWQVSGRSELTLDQRVLLDLRYLAERRFWFDTKILLMTVTSVLRGNGV